MNVNLEKATSYFTSKKIKLHVNLLEGCTIVTSSRSSFARVDFAVIFLQTHLSYAAYITATDMPKITKMARSTGHFVPPAPSNSHFGWR